MSIEEVEKQIRESAPLSDRLTDCKDRIGKMCAEGRPPKMSIPAQWNDDDLFICTTLSDAQAIEREKDEELAWMMNRNIDLERMWNASERYAKHCVTTIKETEAALAAAQGEVERLRETLDDIAHVGNYEASQRAIDALKEAKGECHHLTAYYNEEADNYYCSECHRGMGIAYYNVAQALLKTERQKQEIQKSPQTP